MNLDFANDCVLLSGQRFDTARLNASFLLYFRRDFPLAGIASSNVNMRILTALLPEQVRFLHPTQPLGQPLHVRIVWQVGAAGPHFQQQHAPAIERATGFVDTI